MTIDEFAFNLLKKYHNLNDDDYIGTVKIGMDISDFAQSVTEENYCLAVLESGSFFDFQYYLDTWERD